MQRREKETDSGLWGKSILNRATYKWNGPEAEVCGECLEISTRQWSELWRQEQKAESKGKGTSHSVLGTRKRASVKDVMVRPKPGCVYLLAEKISFDLTELTNKREKYLTCSWSVKAGKQSKK